KFAGARQEPFRFRAFASLSEHRARPGGQSLYGEGSANGGQSGGIRPQRTCERGSASTTMHSVATISSKLPNSKAKSENPTLRESQNSDVAQIRNTDHTHRSSRRGSFLHRGHG